MLKKFLLKFLDIYQPEPIDEKKMKDWLFKSHRERGFKNYYTMRKRYLVNLILLDLSAKDRYKIQGRLEELSSLTKNISEEYKRRKEKL